MALRDVASRPGAPDGLAHQSHASPKSRERLPQEGGYARIAGRRSSGVLHPTHGERVGGALATSRGALPSIALCWLRTGRALR